MSLQTTRRQILGGVGAGFGCGTVINKMFEPPQSQAEQATIDVNLFVASDHIADFSKSRHPESTPYATVNRVAEHIEYAFTNLAESVEGVIDVDVSVIKSPVPTEELEYDIVGSFLSSWEEYLYESIPEQNRATDANILITTRSGKGNVSFTGNAHAPCSMCDGGNHTVGVLYEMEQRHYASMESGQIHTSCYAATPTAQLMIAVHEVGHTIGLRHTDGEIITSENEDPHLTLMATTKDVPETFNFAIRKLEFSDTITRSDLRLSEDGGIGERTETPSLLDVATRIVNLG